MLSIENKNEQNTVEDISDLSGHKYNLYQHFFIVGLDPKLINSLNKIDLKTFPDSYLAPKIISKYPPNELYYLNIPDSTIASHCFPNGIKKLIIHYNSSNYEENIKYQNNYVFSLENQYIEDKVCSLRTNRLYFSCLLFYENIENYQEYLSSKNHKQKKFDFDLYNIEEAKNQSILIPKVICLSSFRPYFEQSKVILEKLKNYVDNYLYNKNTFDNFNIYPIESIIKGLIYNLPALPRSNITLKLNKDTFEINAMDKDDNICGFDEIEKNIDKNIDKNNKNNKKIVNNEIIFFETPFNQQPKNFVNYSLLMKYFRIKEIFEIVKFILLEEPILFFCEDIHVLTYTIEGFLSLLYPFEYQYPAVSVLPEENYSFITVFKHFVFGINYKYSDDLLSKKGISLDEKKYIIAIKLEKRFEKILNGEEEDKLPYSVIAFILSDVNKPCVKIEIDKLDKSNEIIPMPDNGIDGVVDIEKRQISLPFHYLEKSAKRLVKNTTEKFKEYAYKNKKKKLTIEEKENLFNTELRRIFIYFFSCLLLRYQSFCIKFEKQLEILGTNDLNNSNNNKILETSLITNSKEDHCSKDDKDFDFFLGRSADLEEKYLLNKLTITDLFNCKNFIHDTPQLDRSFYKNLFETQMFFQFLSKKIFPNSSQDKLDILFFDYKVNEKLSRGSRKLKVETKFFNEEIENLSREININSFKREPSKKLRDFLKKNNNYKKAINYFQIISKKKKDINFINENNNENNNNSDSETNDTGLFIISLKQACDDMDDNLSKSNGKKSNNNLSIEKEDENDDDNKMTFSYYVFPKLLNDGVFYKENILSEESETENCCLKNRNNYNIKNCNYLYNQFEKEAIIFIKNPNIEQNYKLYDYNINTKYTYNYGYEESIGKLWLLYLAKTFYSISISKKRYYFEEILMFLNDEENKVDQNTIILLFNAINKYGDKKMNEELFMFLDRKKYINFLFLREKTREDNNFVKYTNNSSKYYLGKNRGSTNPEDIMSYLNELDLDPNKIKIHKKINTQLFDFYLHSYCSNNLNANDVSNNNDNNNNNICGEQLIFSIKDIFKYENYKKNNKKYIELQCPKCKKIQNVTVSCFFNDGNNNKTQINFNLRSPLAILKKTWFKTDDKIDMLYISNNYPEEYFSSLFYFYEQGFPCNFLIPKGVQTPKIKIMRATTYNNIDPIDDEKISTHKYNLKTPRLTKREINLSERLNIFDIKKGVQKDYGRKSPSPKKSNLSKRSKFSKKLKVDDFDLKPKVTFSLFKK